MLHQENRHEKVQLHLFSFKLKCVKFKLKYVKFKWKYVKFNLKYVKFNLKYVQFKLKLENFKLKCVKFKFKICKFQLKIFNFIWKNINSRQYLLGTVCHTQVIWITNQSTNMVHINRFRTNEKMRNCHFIPNKKCCDILWYSILLNSRKIQYKTRCRPSQGRRCIPDVDI